MTCSGNFLLRLTGCEGENLVVKARRTALATRSRCGASAIRHYRITQAPLTQRQRPFRQRQWPGDQRQLPALLGRGGRVSRRGGGIGGRPDGVGGRGGIGCAKAATGTNSAKAITLLLEIMMSTASEIPFRNLDDSSGRISAIPSALAS